MVYSKSYVCGESNFPLLGQSIGENLSQTVQRFPLNEAIVDKEQSVRLTYDEMWEMTGKIAKALYYLGMRKGDRLGICMPNRYEWTIIQYASARIGVILVNINPAFRASELEYVINHSRLKLLICQAVYKGTDYKDIVNKIKDECPDLLLKLFLEDDWRRLLRFSAYVSDQRLSALEKKVEFDEPINIQYTSGTTGSPKGVTLSHHNILNNGYFIARRMKYSSKDRVCIPVPLFHCFGMVIGNLACTTHGATMVYPGEGFRAEIVLDAVDSEQCTSLYGVPTMFIAMLQLPDFAEYNLTSLRTGVMAGSPCPEEIMKQVQSKMHMEEVTICYGMTETSPVSTHTHIDAPFHKRVSTVGTVQDHLEMKVIDVESGAILDVNQVGEICTRGYSVMMKYWDSPESTAKVIDDAGWMHTGDLGSVDEEGYVKVTGRIKDIIIRGGENISPREIEEFLYTHPAIEDVQIIGVPDKKYGEEIMAWVKLKIEQNTTPEQLIEFCRNRIAHYKIPRYWKFVESFPMTVSGKVRKVEMRAISILEMGNELI